jgi:SAM-dependent methyltransferase
MNHVWWRSHLRRLPELGPVALFGDFNEVDESLPFITEALDLPAGSPVLEMGCGRGSYCVRLAQWGYRVTGVDESEPMLAVARGRADQREVEVEFRRSDMRSLPERGVYGGALIMDFGSLSDPDNASMLRAVAAAMKPGAKVIFGTINPYYWAREARPEHRVIEGVDVIRRFTFDFPSGMLVSKVRCILPHGERKTLPEARYRAYTLPELRNLIAATNLADLRVYGQDEEGRPRTDEPLDNLRTPVFHCVAVKPVTGESGEGI